MLYIWNCRRKELFSSITGGTFEYEIELYLGCNSNKKGILMHNWGGMVLGNVGVRIFIKKKSKKKENIKNR